MCIKACLPYSGLYMYAGCVFICGLYHNSINTCWLSSPGEHAWLMCRYPSSVPDQDICVPELTLVKQEMEVEVEGESIQNAPAAATTTTTTTTSGPVDVSCATPPAKKSRTVRGCVCVRLHIVGEGPQCVFSR
jgi:hypothetical protein